MVTLPTQVTDIFLAANQQISGSSQQNIPGFTAPILPSVSNSATRQSRIPSSRAGIQRRNLIRWFVPETGIVEMYINPQSISIQDKKTITPQRTKGGFVLQYWGEELTTISLSGTTGSSGIEGINVLNDVYRAEQVAFDPYALSLAADRSLENQDQFSFAGDFPTSSIGALLGGAGESFLSLVGNAVQSGSPAVTRMQPTLAALAFAVEMYWSGTVYRGYFTDFKVDERAERLGLFDYSITFMATEKRGIRQNFLGWHRSATNGPSNSDPQFGPPYSFTHEGVNTPAFVPPQSSGGISITDALQSSKTFIGGALGLF